MNEEAMRQALRQCIELKGTEILADKARFKGVIQDILPGYTLQKERNLLIIAAESFSLGRKFLEAPSEETVRAHVFQLLLKELIDNGLSPEAASAVMNSFAAALDWKVNYSGVGSGASSAQPSAGISGSCAHENIDFSAFRCRDCAQPLYGLFGDNVYTPYEKLRRRERSGVLLSISDSCAGVLALPDRIESLGDDCLAEQQELLEVILPASLRSIGKYAFDACPALKTLNVPSTVTTIGEGAFHGLKRVCYSGPAAGSPWGAEEHIKDGPSSFPAPHSAPHAPQSAPHAPQSAPNQPQPIRSRISPKAFIADKADINFAYNCYGDLKEITIPNSVKYIGNYAFNGCVSLKSAVIPDSAAAIGEAAFQGCSSLESVVIPDSVVSIGQGAFFGCAGLKSVFIPDSVVSIGQGAFMGCGKLASVRLPKGLKVIPKSAFAYCAALTDITIPDSVASVKEYAFIGCSSLTVIKVPDSTASIEQGAFTDIKRVYYDGSAAGSPWGAKTHIKNGSEYSPVSMPEQPAFGRLGEFRELALPDDILNIGKRD